MTRRIIVALVMVGMLLLGGLGLVATIHWLTVKDSSPLSRAMRSRLTTVETDQFVLALLATPHATQSTQEIFACQPLTGPDNWNFRAVARGGLEDDRVADVLAQAAAFGWQASGPDLFAKTIAAGVVVRMQAFVGAGTLRLDANTSTGPPCP